ncbi:NADH:ubiquinone oxidoreductase, Na [Acinetobacter sp. TGL-Y2]|nr:NADH:ubiquinone oxidoreductase, Na [Acinetobacter sp. TGL-Y2]
MKNLIKLILKHLSMIVAMFVLVQQSWALEPQKLVTDARQQIGKTLYYDPAYTSLKYPMGDVPLVKGVCTDVIIRALRLQGIDLQQRIHEDMKKNFSAYPKKWGLKTTDRNIDHRRVPNIMTYFKRQNYTVKNQQYLAGDIVTWDLGKGLVHIGILSDRKSVGSNTPLVIHNIGQGTQENNILHQFKMIGHYRIPQHVR